VREANRRASARPTRGVLGRRSQLILVFYGQDEARCPSVT